MFYRHVLFRNSCYNCKYTTTQRNTDFTIADYWGIGENAPRFNDNKGVSLVLVHSDKGREIIKEIKDNFDMERTNIETSMQPQLSKPIWKGYDYNSFWKAYRKAPGKTIKKYFFPSKIRKVYLSIEKTGKKLVKKVINLIKK
jgi:coenzyme F420-reducing hydrogenase beta subunit